MTFGEKLRQCRIKKDLTQTELAAAAGITLRSVQNYESGKRYPSSMAITVKLADTLDTTSSYLLGEEGGYILEAQSKAGASKRQMYTAQREMRMLVEQVSGLFAGGELSEDDRDAAIQALTEAYWIAKKESKKYSPKNKK